MEVCLPRKTYRTVSHHDLPRMTDDEYDRARLDTHGAWCDLQQRARVQSERQFGVRSRLTGDKPGDVSKLYGFKQPPPVALKQRRQDPFVQRENAFTSGTVVVRQYDKAYSVTDACFDAVRSDGHHGPNVFSTKDSDFWQDWRSGNRNPEGPPQHMVRPLDRDLRTAIKDDSVSQWMRASRGEKVVANLDQDATARALFDDVKPTARNLERWNIDLSCMDLDMKLKSDVLGVNRGKAALAAQERQTQERWAWCNAGSSAAAQKDAFGAAAPQRSRAEGTTGVPSARYASMTSAQVRAMSHSEMR